MKEEARLRHSNADSGRQRRMRGSSAGALDELDHSKLRTQHESPIQLPFQVLVAKYYEAIRLLDIPYLLQT